MCWVQILRLIEGWSLLTKTFGSLANCLHPGECSSWGSKKYRFRSSSQGEKSCLWFLCLNLCSELSTRTLLQSLRNQRSMDPVQAQVMYGQWGVVTGHMGMVQPIVHTSLTSTFSAVKLKLAMVEVWSPQKISQCCKWGLVPQKVTYQIFTSTSLCNQELLIITYPRSRVDLISNKVNQS